MNKQPISYLQTDPRWKNTSYSVKGENTTIGASGCGPTAMAMVLATLCDPNVTPKTECAWALKNGYKCLKSGTYYSYFVPAAKRYGLACTMLNGASIYGNSASAYHAKAKAAIANGDLVIACMGKGNWTSSGHYVLVWDIDEAKDVIYINDPASILARRTRGSYSLFKKQVKYYWVIKVPKTSSAATPTTPVVKITEISDTVRVTDKTGLNCRSGAGTSYGIVKAYPYGAVLTITKAASNGWGYTGEGWVNLAHTEKVTIQKEEELDMTIDEMLTQMTDEQAYELVNKAFNHMGDREEPGWSKAEGFWQKAVADGTINGGAPERPLRRDEFIAVLGRKGLL